MDQRAIYIEKLKYKRLAYCVVRDAIGFYFGIQKFFELNNPKDAYTKIVQSRLEIIEREKGRKPTEREILKCKKFVRRLINARIKELKIDYVYTKQVLFTDNLWTEHLDINADYFRSYLENLPQNEKDALAVVPKWTTYDHSLGRPYINDNFDMTSMPL